MNISLNSLSNHAVYRFRENASFALSAQAKNILLGVSLAFNCLTLCYILMNHYSLIAKSWTKFNQHKNALKAYQIKKVIVKPNTLEAKVVELKPVEVKAIAKKIIATMMNRLQIDVFHGPVKGETYPDTSGKLHQVYWTQYDRSSKFMQALLPVVGQQISQAFSSPTHFLDNGIEFKVIDDGQGLAEQINDLFVQSQVKAGRKHILKNLMLNSLQFTLTLKLNQATSTSTNELHFDIYSKTNGSGVGHTGGSVKSFEEYALKAKV